MARLYDLYKAQIVPEMLKTFGYKNRMQIPRLKKIVVSMGVGQASKDKKLLEAAVRDLTKISGQKPKICRAKRSVSNFKLREGMEIGCMVTLRRARMYEFLDRLVSLAVPRVRDFRGLNTNGFDGAGNYNMGLGEQLVFPEVNPDDVQQTQGMNITMVTSAETDEEARTMLKLFGMPFRGN